MVLEPTDLELHIGCQGFINAKLIFEGTSAHSSRPWLGENAITKAGAFLTEMHAWAHRPVRVEGFEYTEVFSITKASGGIAHNIIPDRFEVTLNHRFPPDLSLEEAEARMKSVARAADRIEIIDRAPGAAAPADNPHFERLQEVSGAAQHSKQGWTDVARLAALGIPAVNYGPGEAFQAHRVGESVDLTNLDEGFRVLKSFLTT